MRVMKCLYLKLDIVTKLISVYEHNFDRSQPKKYVRNHKHTDSRYRDIILSREHSSAPIGARVHLCPNAIARTRASVRT